MPHAAAPDKPHKGNWKLQFEFNFTSLASLQLKSLHCLQLNSPLNSIELRLNSTMTRQSWKQLGCLQLVLGCMGRPYIVVVFSKKQIEDGAYTANRQAHVSSSCACAPQCPQRPACRSTQVGIMHNNIAKPAAELHWPCCIGALLQLQRMGASAAARIVGVALLHQRRQETLVQRRCSGKWGCQSQGRRMRID